jgi:SAM-dependent MidA family methyltransferase
MATALYGPRGFYSTGPGPGAHFRTSVTASGVLAEGLAVLVEELDELLDHPDELAVVDVGAGDGRLLKQVRQALAPTTPLRSRLRLTAVDLGARPVDLDGSVAWEHEVPRAVVGLVIAHELLDNVPVDVVEVDEDGQPRDVLVDEDGHEQLGAAISTDVTGWLDRWWPLSGAGAGERAEVGLLRDEQWRSMVDAVDRGVAIAVDYGHTRHDRSTGRWAGGTLAAYRGGRLVPVRLDGSCDVTAHVALDACAAAGRDVGAQDTTLISQHDALRRLGVRPSRPPVALATTAPVEYLAALQRLGEVSEVLDPDGLGGFTWLVQSKGCEVPAALSGR